MPVIAGPDQLSEEPKLNSHWRGSGWGLSRLQVGDLSKKPTDLCPKAQP